ncbi:hypothetical protein ADT71_20970 [Novosphingobium sp. ST904]|nr:hypothetical protein ADT71_20970 [Novosphingobium sp. ST904]
MPRHASSAAKVSSTLCFMALYPIAPIRQIRPCRGPKAVPISISNCCRIAMRTASPSTPSGMNTPVTLVIRWASSPNSVSPMARSPAAIARPAAAWRA